MASTVPLNRIEFVDETGYATHLHVEILQDLPFKGGNIRTVSRSIPVHGGKGVLTSPGLDQVFSVVAQPVVSREPGRHEPYGTVMEFTAPPTEFLHFVRVVTTGTLIPRTALAHFGIASPGSYFDGMEDLDDAFHPRQFEVGFDMVEYHDFESGGLADELDLVVYGVKDGQSGEWPDSTPVQNGVATYTNPALTDITRIDLTPQKLVGSSFQAYGNPVTQTSARGFFLTKVVARANPPKNDPHNTATNEQSGPVLFRRTSLSQSTLVPQQGPARKSKGAAPGKQGSRART